MRKRKTYLIKNHDGWYMSSLVSSSLPSDARKFTSKVTAIKHCQDGDEVYSMTGGDYKTLTYELRRFV